MQPCVCVFLPTIAPGNYLIHTLIVDSTASNREVRQAWCEALFESFVAQRRSILFGRRNPVAESGCEYGRKEECSVRVSFQAASI